MMMDEDTKPNEREILEGLQLWCENSQTVKNGYSIHKVEEGDQQIANINVNHINIADHCYFQHTVLCYVAQ